MIIAPKRDWPDQGIFFAIWPRRTPQGLAVGWLHYQWVEGWGWGSDGYWSYANWVPEKEYNEGKRAQAEFEKLDGTCDNIENNFNFATHAEPFEGMTFASPPHKSKCKNLRTDGPTPCWYPHCTCMNIGGSTCGDHEPYQPFIGGSMSDSMILALAARAAGMLENTCDSLEDLAERDERTAEVVDGAQFLKYLDTMVFCCTTCGWWYRQCENATPDGAEWECLECHQ